MLYVTGLLSQHQSRTAEISFGGDTPSLTVGFGDDVAIADGVLIVEHEGVRTYYAPGQWLRIVQETRHTRETPEELIAAIKARAAQRRGLPT